MISCLQYFCLLWILFLCNLFEYVQCDAVCDSRFGFPVKYCYGVTAYCCGEHYQQCCWQKIWKVWWFWVVAFVVVTALFSCCGYYCSSTAESGRYGLLRSDSFNVFHRFRRLSSRDYSPTNEEWKPPNHVQLPPYTPLPPANERPGTSVDPTPAQNMPYLEPPPPYTTAIEHPQPESGESTTLLPSAPSAADNNSYNTAGTTVSSH